MFRNVQVIFVEKPQFKIISFQNQNCYLLSDNQGTIVNRALVTFYHQIAKIYLIEI